MKKAAKIVCSAMVILGFAVSTRADQDVNAGPIWNNADAQGKCPAVCGSVHSEWNGQWRTTQTGVQSVCGCKADRDMHQERRDDRAVADECDSMAHRSTAERIDHAELFLSRDAACVRQREAFCESVRWNASRDAGTYTALLAHDRDRYTRISVAGSCGLDMAAVTRSICHTLNEANYTDLAPTCPAEAMRYREALRCVHCDGRSYTADRPYTAGRDEGADRNPAAEVLNRAKELKSGAGY
jgi:Mannan-binding protein